MKGWSSGLIKDTVELFTAAINTQITPIGHASFLNKKLGYSGAA